MRLHVVPILMPAFFAFKSVRRYLFRTVSQATINYRGSSLSEGQAGLVHGGDRLPWVPASSDGMMKDNFARLKSLDWQVHVYGDALPEVKAVCDLQRLPLHVFPWYPGIDQTGLRRNAFYLVRPDGYVALADPEGNAKAIKSYFDTRKLIPMG